MDTNTLAQGTWIRSKVAVSDSGDWNERTAPAGALGLIDGVDASRGKTSYTVVFWPSFITNFWDADEVAADAEVLPANHPDIPAPDAYDLASAVADIVADGDVDTDEGVVTFPGSLAKRIVAGAGAFRGGRDAVMACVSGWDLDGDEIEITAGEFDRLAELVGVGDRLSETRDDVPSERP